MSEEIEHLQTLAEKHRKNIQSLEEMLASYGLDRPLHLQNSLDFEREELAKVEVRIAELEGRVVETRIFHNLPPRTNFVGREREKREVLDALESRSFLVTVDGIGGIGKTALALEVAHDCWNQGLFSGIVWVTAKDRELSFNDVLDTIARILDYPGITRLDFKEKTGEVQQLLRSGRYLVVVDNFETIEEDREEIRRFLCELPEPSKGLITSRQREMMESKAVSLRGMAKGEALVLIRSEGERLGLQSVLDAEDKVLLRLYKATGGAPLAMKWALGQIRQRGQSLDGVLESLRQARGDIFENIFARSWRLLTEEVQCILMIMPIFASSASKEAIGAVSDVHGYGLDEGLAQLVEMWLIEKVSGELGGQERYSVHPLTRSFAEAELLQRPDFSEHARLRAATWFLNYAKQYGGYANWQGFPRLEIELDNVLAALNWCYECGNERQAEEFWKTVIDFKHTIDNFLFAYGYWGERIELGHQTARAANEVGDESTSARTLLWTLGWTELERRNLDEAEQVVSESLRLYEKLDDQRNIAAAKRLLGEVARFRGEYKKAQELLGHALAIQRQLAPTSLDSCTTLVSFGLLAKNQRDYEAAQQYFGEALEIARTRDFWDARKFAMITLGHLGDIAQKQGKLEEARQLYNRALEKCETTAVHVRIAEVKSGLGLLEKEMGNHARAKQLLTEALEMYRRMHLAGRADRVGQMLKSFEREER